MTDTLPVEGTTPEPSPPTAEPTPQPDESGLLNPLPEPPVFGVSADLNRPDETTGVYIVLWAWATVETTMRLSGDGAAYAVAHDARSGSFEPLAIVKGHGPDHAIRQASNPEVCPDAARWVRYAAAIRDGLHLRAVPLASWPADPTPARLERPAPQLKIG
jgi:hypothetical protein